MLYVKLASTYITLVIGVCVATFCYYMYLPETSLQEALTQISFRFYKETPVCSIWSEDIAYLFLCAAVNFNSISGV